MQQAGKQSPKTLQSVPESYRQARISMIEMQELRQRFPYRPYKVYDFGEAMCWPFEDDGIWIFARETEGDPTSARYVPLDDRARERGHYVPDFGEHFENYSPVKDLLP